MSSDGLGSGARARAMVNGTRQTIPSRQKAAGEKARCGPKRLIASFRRIKAIIRVIIALPPLLWAVCSNGVTIKRRVERLAVACRGGSLRVVAGRLQPHVQSRTHPGPFRLSG